MDHRKHRTPSGLPPANFEEPRESLRHVDKPINELDFIIRVGVWPPPSRGYAPATAVAHQAPTWLFRPQDASANVWTTIVWWEKRRLAFNAVIIGIGVLAIALQMAVTFAFQAKVAGVAYAESDTLLLLAPTVLIWGAIAANIGYTGGCVIECVLRGAFRNRDSGLGPSLLNIGICLSVAAIAYFFVISLHQALCR